MVSSAVNNACMKMSEAEKYGVELVLDLHGCDAEKFTCVSLDGFFEKLCEAIGVGKCG